MPKSNIWSYKQLEINEGLKPQSRHFQYFFVVSEGGKQKCNYCVWIDDKNLGLLSSSKSFDEIISAHKGEWTEWVKDKIDEEDFRNLVWRVEKTGWREINLGELDEKLEPE